MMSETPNQGKSVPPRRRQGRNTAKKPGQKMYASENDMPSHLPGLPRTPQKSASRSPAPFSGGLEYNPQGQQHRGPNHANALSTNSPDINRNAHRTPPHGHVNKQPASTAFAGATFHASPAASALPIPSFLSKSNPKFTARQNDERAHQQPSPPATDPNPLERATSGLRESPLEAIFRADRAEKAKAKRPDSTPGLAGPSHPLSTAVPDQSYMPSPDNARWDPHFHDRPSPGRNSSDELDGTPGKMVGPAFSRPYQDRIREARRAPAPADQAQAPTPDRSDALKKFLFSGREGPPRPSLSSSLPAQSREYSFGEQSVRGPPAAEASRPADLRAMEDSLRKLLKLDSSLAPASRSTGHPM